GKTILTDDSGKANFPLIFNDTSYIESRELEVIKENKIIAKREIVFFTETPIIIIHNGDSTTDFVIISFIALAIIGIVVKRRKKN
ncbi:MAG: LPXTG cell wall anchor domain-containing protein, partial [Candidatus Hodarchaeales archaeon]